MRVLLLSLSFILTLIAPAWVALAQPALPGRPVVVIFPPWIDADALVQRAGGQIIGPSLAPLAALASSDQPTFAARLRSLGAWTVRDASRIVQICGAI